MPEIPLTADQTSRILQWRARRDLLLLLDLIDEGVTRKQIGAVVGTKTYWIGVWEKTARDEIRREVGRDLTAPERRAYYGALRQWQAEIRRRINEGVGDDESPHPPAPPRLEDVLAAA